ncbi:ATP-binding protein [Fluviispira vulneris]|uniref:ATP-binding protein n=1 Tax=Fluviispira vulneris TaxID=2763012 RepID=UPI0016471741|nr:hybrid sensor histidine kinase/response regulator [Fluviispira vulneris]
MYLIAIIYFLIIFAIFLISKHLLKIRLKSYQHFVNQIKSAEMTGITTSIRMLAHDIRAPFSMLNIIISSIEKSKNLTEVNAKLSKSKIDLNIYLEKVTNMLNDFMRFGKNENIESFNPEDIVYSSLLNSSKISEICKINFSYKFTHKNNICFSKIQFERILNNLISNAIEAMSGIGNIWFHTKNIVVNEYIYIEFCVGNNNAYISEENIQKIFDLNFTIGKETGNGIGLYSVKTLIESSGGTIYCRSAYERGVEFIFSIPASSDKVSPPKYKFLPDNSDVILKLNIDNYLENRKELSLDNINQINNEILYNNYKISVLLIDDEEKYLSALYELSIEIFLGSEKNISFYKANNYDEAIRIYNEEKPNIIISDIDLKDNFHTGFDIIKYVLDIDKNCYICIHTNRIFSQDRVFEMGAKQFIAKPISKSRLYEIFYDYLLQKKNLVNINNNDLKETVLVVDDSDFYLKMWKKSLIDVNVLVFESPEALIEKIQEDSEILKNISCIILDYYFDGYKQNIVQMNFVDLLRRYGYKNPCFLSSEVCCSEQELKVFDGFIEKQPNTFSNIKNMFPDKFKRMRL